MPETRARSRSRKLMVPGMLALVAVSVASIVVWQTSDDGGPSHPDRWDRRVVDLVDFVERERDLAFDHPVTVDFLSPGEYAKRTRVDANELSDEDRQDYADRVAPLRAFGLVSHGLDLVEVGNDLADTGTLAFYDSGTERISVRGTKLSVDLRVTLVHELTHALQDQHFDLDRLLDTPDASGEQVMAYTALVEGDAIRVENAYVDRLGDHEFRAYADAADQASEDAQAGLGEVPDVLVGLQAAPYALGPALVELIAADGGNAAVDDAFDSPPATTEQMLDPRAYFAKDNAVEVDAPHLVAGVQQIGEADSLGAVALYLLLSERIEPVDALAAADGWGGDRYVAFSGQGGESCVVADVRGDSRSDDREIRSALRSWVDAGPRGSASVDDTGQVLTSCEPTSGTSAGEPGSASESSRGRALDALTLPAVRAEVMSATGDPDPDAAFAVGDCFVHAVPFDTLLEANESAEPSAALSTTIQRAIVGCSANAASGT